MIGNINYWWKFNCSVQRRIVVILFRYYEWKSWHVVATNFLKTLVAWSQISTLELSKVLCGGIRSYCLWCSRRSQTLSLNILSEINSLSFCFWLTHHHAVEKLRNNGQKNNLPYSHLIDNLIRLIAFNFHKKYSTKMETQIWDQ